MTRLASRIVRYASAGMAGVGDRADEDEEEVNLEGWTGGAVLMGG